jgi:diaminopimelate epimerase
MYDFIDAGGSLDVIYHKYSAAGNTFLVFDNRLSELNIDDIELWQRKAKEHEVDGVLFLESSDAADFKMRYLNADGNEVDMCGNGIRTLSAFARDALKLSACSCPPFYSIETKKGVYFADPSTDPIRVKMTELYDENLYDISDLYPSSFSYYMNTGVPHCIYEVNDLDNFDLPTHGKFVRQHHRFNEGVNVNFFEMIKKGEVKVRTYERGVEGETLSCGTGSLAVALSCVKRWGWQDKIKIITKGGELIVTFQNDSKDVFLAGPVVETGKGTLVF